MQGRLIVHKSQLFTNHKLQMKALVETRMWLRIIAKREYTKPELLVNLMDELEELVKIFHSSIKTARRNLEEA